MNYRDLTGDDVLQAGDEWLNMAGKWERVNSHLGTCSANWPFACFRRPLTPAEITAAERVRFKEWCNEDVDCYSDGEFKGYFVNKTTRYLWESWCAAVNCDPMADVTTD